MNRISIKKTIYIIDGMNFYFSVFNDFFQDKNKMENDFYQWLDMVSGSFKEYEFLVILDGSFRTNRLNAGNIRIIFSDPDNADNRICEQARFYRYSNSRCIAVSDDKELRNSLKEIGIKTVGCKKFYNLIMGNI